MDTDKTEYTDLELEQANDRDRAELTKIVNVSQALTIAATDIELSLGRMRAQIEDLGTRAEELSACISARVSIRTARAMRAVAASAKDSRSVAQRYLDGVES